VSFLLSALQLSIDIDRSIAAGAVLQARRRSAANAGSVMLTADEGGAIQTCNFGDDGKIRSRRLDYWDMKEGESKRLGAVEIKAALSSVRVYFTGISAHSCIARLSARRSPQETFSHREMHLAHANSLDFDSHTRL